MRFGFVLLPAVCGTLVLKGHDNVYTLLTAQIPSVASESRYSTTSEVKRDNSARRTLSLRSLENFRYNLARHQLDRGFDFNQRPRPWFVATVGSGVVQAAH
jgi:hypothetical protein